MVTVSREFADGFGDSLRRFSAERTSSPDLSVAVIATVFRVRRVRRTYASQRPRRTRGPRPWNDSVLVGVALLLNVTFGVVEVGPGTRDRPLPPRGPPSDPRRGGLYTGDSPDHIDDIACLRDEEDGRICALELSLLERQPSATESTPSVVVPVSETSRAADAPFAFHQGDFYPFSSQYYERTREEGRPGLEPIGEHGLRADSGRTRGCRPPHGECSPGPCRPKSRWLLRERSSRRTTGTWYWKAIESTATGGSLRCIECWPRLCSSSSGWRWWCARGGRSGTLRSRRDQAGRPSVAGPPTPRRQPSNRSTVPAPG